MSLMTLSELVRNVENAGQDCGSNLNMRSEELQTKQRAAMIPMRKNALKKKSKLLLEMELALPFDPETGKESEKWNVSHKYRPPMSATTVALALKNEANANDALKQTLMKRSGVTDWDTSDSEHFTEQDWKVFSIYRVPRVFSISAIHVNIPAMNGRNQFGRDYAVSIKRNQDGEVIGELPLCMKVSKFFTDTAYEELTDYNAKVKNGTIKATDEQQKKKRQEIFGNMPVSSDRPLNYVFMYELPMDASQTVSADVINSVEETSSLKQYEVISRYTSAIRSCVEKYCAGDYAKYDKFLDFVEIDQSGPVSGDDSTMSGKAEIGRNTQFAYPMNGLRDTDTYGNGDGTYKTDKLVATVRDAIDEDLDIEKRVRRSIRVPMLDESVENQIISSISSVIDLESKYVTKRVLEQNKEFVLLALGDEGAEAIEELEAGVTERTEGALDSDNAAKETKKYDLSALEESEVDDLESLDLAVDE